MSHSSLRRFGLLGLAVTLFALLVWQQNQSLSRSTPLPTARTQTARMDFRRIGASFAFAFVCFQLLGAYDERPEEPGAEVRKEVAPA